MRVLGPRTNRDLVAGTATLAYFAPSPPPTALREGNAQRSFSHLEVKLLDVDETRRLHRLPLQLILQHSKRLPHLLPALGEELAPLSQRRVLRDGRVVALEHARRLDALVPAARAAGLEGLRKEGVPVGCAAKEPAAVDVVEGVGGEGPVLGVVVDFTGAERPALAVATVRGIEVHVAGTWRLTRSIGE